MNRRDFVKTATAASAAASLAANVPAAWAAPNRLLLFLGTRVGGPGKGISSCFVDLATGAATPLTLAAEWASPTSFVVSPDMRVLYATSETGNDGKSDGGVGAFQIDRATGTLTPLNRVPSGGGGPTYLALDKSGKTLAVSCFGAGRTNTFPIQADGQLGPQISSIADTGSGPTPRQKSPHVHCSVFSPGNRFVVAADLGADRIFVSHFDAATGMLTPAATPFVQCPVGSGPRQIAFHPGGKFVYMLSELTAVVTAYTWNEKDGSMRQVQALDCITTAGGERSGAGIVAHRNGKFLYTTTRSDNAMEVYSIDAATGMLTQIQRLENAGKVPWSCALDLDGKHFLTTDYASNSVSIYTVDGVTGKLVLLKSVQDIPAPVAVAIVPV